LVPSPLRFTTRFIFCMNHCGHSRCVTLLWREDGFVSYE
jgi:hypothetical protein